MTQPALQPIRRSFVWNFAGNSIYSLAQWLLLVLLARLANAAEVGEFALILAISAPVFLVAGMNLRIVQNTDAAGEWRLEDYLLLRHLLNVVATVVTLLIVLVVGSDAAFVWATLAICGAKVVEALSQTYYGYFQQVERHDFVAQSMLVRSVCGPSLFAVGYLLSDQLVGGGLGLLLGWLIPQVLLDRPRAKRLMSAHGRPLGRLLPGQWRALGRLVRKGAPLGLDQGASSLAVNVPRYVVQGYIGAAALGVFTALSYLSQVISMITSALGMVVVPRLARYKHDGKRRAFVRLLILSTLFSVAVSLVAVLGAWLLGEWFIRTVLGAEFVHQELLIVLMLGGAVVTIQRCLGRALTGARKFITFLVIDTITLAAVAVAAFLLVPDHGLMGAAWSTIIGNAVGVIVCLLPVGRVIGQIGAPAARTGD